MTENAEILKPEKTDENLLKKELEYNKFRKLGEKYFGLGVEPANPALEKIKEAARLYSFALPIEQTEIVFIKDEAPIFWLLDSPLIKKIELYYKSKIADKEGIYSSIKDVYSKWILLKTPREKKFFAASAISAIEDNLDKNYLYYSILYSMILTYEESVYDPETALVFLKKAEEKLEHITIEPDYKNELRYYLKVYNALIKIKSGESEEARQILEEALLFKPGGINAKLYLLSLNGVAESGESIKLIEEIIEFDNSRAKRAIGRADANLFNHCITFNASRYLFSMPNLAIYRAEILEMINMMIEGNSAPLDRLEKNIKVVEDFSLRKEVRKKELDELSFIKNMISRYMENENVIFKNSLKMFEDKFVDTVRNIVDFKRNQYLRDIDNKLKSFSIGVSEYQKTHENLMRESEGLIEKITKTVEEDIIKFQKKCEEQINLLENRMENMRFEKNLDPQVSFRSSMTYGIIITIIIFIIGAFAGYSNSTQKDFSQVFVNMIIFGLKWSGITFLVSLIFSGIISISVMWERANERNEIMRKISLIGSSKEIEIVKIKAQAEKKQNNIREIYKKKIDRNNEELKKYEEEKQEEERQLREDAEARIELEVGELLYLI